MRKERWEKFQIILEFLVTTHRERLRSPHYDRKHKEWPPNHRNSVHWYFNFCIYHKILHTVLLSLAAVNEVMHPSTQGFIFCKKPREGYSWEVPLLLLITPATTETTETTDTPKDTHYGFLRISEIQFVFSPSARYALVYFLALSGSRFNCSGIENEPCHLN